MPTWVTGVYAILLHLASIAALVVLMATSHLDTTVGLPLLSGLLGLGTGIAVTPGAPKAP